MSTGTQPIQDKPTRGARIAAIMDAIIGAVHEGGAEGAPSGVMYAVLSAYMELGVYQRLMDMMVGAGLLVRSGHLYRLTTKGDEWYETRCNHVQG
jgi:hypothetical protein